MQPIQLVLISGLSGSGKSIALNVLEDAGFYCVDNLPAPLLADLVGHLRREGHPRIAVAADMRGGSSIAALPAQLRQLAEAQVIPSFIFLDARDDVLIQRFSETRRRHPLASGDSTLAEAIASERDALDTLKNLGHRIDTSHLRPNALRSMIRDFVDTATRPRGEDETKGGLSLLFESFGFKHGLPLDADLVFDVRCLPNPHYDPALRPLTGRDAPVIDFLQAQPEVLRMRDDLLRFISDWLPAYIRDNRSYLTVAIGCTGGQHRSVWFAETLARDFSGTANDGADKQATARVNSQLRAQLTVLVRHRALAQ